VLCRHVQWFTRRKAVSKDEWQAVSRTIDFIMAQPTGKPIKESPGVTAIRGEPPKPQRKPKKQKEQPAEQLRLF
jgi:hypothetical protein